jgi:hypothetical protein
LTAGQRVFTLMGGSAVLDRLASLLGGENFMGDIFADNLVIYVGIGAIGLALAFGIVGAVVARARGRGPVKWGLACFLFVPLGFLVLVCLPKARCHPVWRNADTGRAARPDRESDATVNEKDATTLRPASGNGELQRGRTPLAPQPEDEVIDAATRLLESRATDPEIASPQSSRSSFDVSLLEPRTPAPEVAPPQAPSSTLDASLLEPPTAVPSFAPPKAPRSAPAAPTARRTRVPGVPAGYPDFPVLSRGEKKIELQCPNCAAVFRRPNSLMGKLEKCPECRTVMRIPT